MKKGDIVLVPFPFTDLTGNKWRPALVLISTKTDVTVCFITTQFLQDGNTDIPLKPSVSNGLKKDSLLRLSKFATIDKDIIPGKIGNLEPEYLSFLNKKLIEILQLQ